MFPQLHKNPKEKTIIIEYLLIYRKSWYFELVVRAQLLILVFNLLELSVFLYEALTRDSNLLFVDSQSTNNNNNTDHVMDLSLSNKKLDRSPLISVSSG